MAYKKDSELLIVQMDQNTKDIEKAENNMEKDCGQEIVEVLMKVSL